LKTSQEQAPKHLVETGESFEQKFTPVLSFFGWRIAMLRHSKSTDRYFFHQVERHNQTNEVFILTAGKANLIVCENGDEPGEPYVFEMKLNVAYNILPSVWHHVLMSEDAHIIIFEKADTTRENSNYYEFGPESINIIKGYPL
jgi:ureidoglycolate hydrolase